MSTKTVWIDDEVHTELTIRKAKGDYNKINDLLRVILGLDKEDDNDNSPDDFSAKVEPVVAQS